MQLEPGREPPVAIRDEPVRQEEVVERAVPRVCGAALSVSSPSLECSRAREGAGRQEYENTPADEGAAFMR